MNSVGYNATIDDWYHKFDTRAVGLLIPCIHIYTNPTLVKTHPFQVFAKSSQSGPTKYNWEFKPQFRGHLR